MRKNFLPKVAALLTFLFASASFAAAAPTLVCGLTGKESKTCCCEQKDGKLVCQHTGRLLEKCCCTVKK